jgi:hypothetical protein
MRERSDRANGNDAEALGYPAILRLWRNADEELVVEAWLTRVHKRIAKAWLAEHATEDEDG